MTSSNLTIFTKQCTSCHRELPETAQYFTPTKGYKNGLYSQCRECVLERRRKKEGWTKPRKRSPKARDGFLFCTHCDQEFPAVLEFFSVDTRYKSGFKPTCRKCQTIISKDYRGRNPERTKSTKRQWRKNNPDKVKKHKSDSQKRNRASANIRSKRYRDSHPDLIREQSRIRSQRRRKVAGKYTKADIQLQRKAQTNSKGSLICWWCNKPIDEYEIDHRIAIDKGGTHDPRNLCLSCAPCNGSKGTKLPHEWIGRLL